MGVFLDFPRISRVVRETCEEVNFQIGSRGMIDDDGHTSPDGVVAAVEREGSERIARPKTLPPPRGILSAAPPSSAAEGALCVAYGLRDFGVRIEAQRLIEIFPRLVQLP